MNWSTYKNYRSDGVDEGYTENGRWGRAGSGVLVVSPGLDPNFLLFKRSEEVEDPGQWSIPGGALKLQKNGSLSNPLHSAVEELREEAGILPRGDICTDPIVYNKDNYPYNTYVLELSFDKDYYVPRLNWENSEYRWFTKEEVLANPSLHKGIRSSLEFIIGTSD